VRLESSDRMPAEDILKFHSELQSFLDDIEKKGWRYLYVDTRGSAVAEIDLDGSPYKVRVAGVSGTSEMAGGQQILEIALGQKTIKLGEVPEVEMFRINVSTKSFPRAVTLDISKGVISYLNEAFWGWEKGWEQDGGKLAEAREVHEVAEWLLTIKKQKLQESYNLDRYNEISRLLEEG
jgi:hypothetical protein